MYFLNVITVYTKEEQEVFVFKSFEPYKELKIQQQNMNECQDSSLE